MNFSRVLGIALFAVGIALLVLGICATRGADEKVVHTFTGHFTKSTILYILGGIAMIVGGLKFMRSK